VKPADKINELEVNGKNKNISDVYGGKNDFNIDYKYRSNLVNDGMVTYLQILTTL
jgi:hypothetical protein